MNIKISESAVIVNSEKLSAIVGSDEVVVFLHTSGKNTIVRTSFDSVTPELGSNWIYSSRRNVAINMDQVKYTFTVEQDFMVIMKHGNQSFMFKTDDDIASILGIIHY